MVGVVAPVLQVPPLLPERTTLDPVQKVVAPPAVMTEAIGRGLGLIILSQMLVQPFASVTITVYVPVAFTVMQLIDAPVLHK